MLQMMSLDRKYKSLIEFAKPKVKYDVCAGVKIADGIVFTSLPVGRCFATAVVIIIL